MKRQRRGTITVAVAAATAATLAGALPAFSAGPTTKLVSVNSSGQQATDASFGPAISANGRYVAFVSSATNLVHHDLNNKSDVFLRDVANGKTTRVSVSSSGQEANGDSGASNVSISADGRYVAFQSYATNLTGGSPSAGIYVHDTSSGKTRRVSTDQGDPQEPSISSDGRYVVFSSNDGEIYRSDRTTGKVKKISLNNQGVEDNGVGDTPDISDDGHLVVWESDSGNLTSNAGGDHNEIYLRNLNTGKTKLISATGSGVEGNADSFFPVISADGRFIAYQSGATNLVANDTGGHADVFAYSLKTGKTKLASVSSSGVQGNAGSALFSSPSITADGRFIAFTSKASNLVPSDTNHHQDVFVHDRRTGKTQRVSLTKSGHQANDFSEYSAISANGLFVAFQSQATNLVSSDSNGFKDIFRRGPLNGF